MYVIILTPSDDFLATLRALALELPHICINTDGVQELVMRPEVSEEDARHWANNYMACGKYNKVELVWRKA